MNMFSKETEAHSATGCYTAPIPYAHMYSVAKDQLRPDLIGKIMVDYSNPA